jgi:hypothetical protein
MNLPPRVKDLTGQRFGKRTVLAFDGIRKPNGAYWLCVCDCGTKDIVQGTALYKRRADHCMKCKGEIQSHRQTDDLTGQQFNDLSITNKNKRKVANGDTYWNCLCKCGKKVVAKASDLKTEQTKSCGCQRKENGHNWGKVISAANKRLPLLKIDRKEAYRQELQHREAIESGALELDPTEQLEVEQKLEAARTDVLPPWAKGN